MHHRNRTTTEAQYAPPYSHDTRRQKHSMHHRNRTTTEAQYAPLYSHDTRRPKHSLHLHIRTNTNHYELTCVATKSHHQHLMFTTVVSTVTSSVEPCDLNPPCLSKHVGFEPQHFVASTCPPSLPTAAARAMSVSVKGTATLKNGKVSLVLQPDVQDIRPDTRATATGSNSNEDDVQIDVRAAMMKKIADGLMPVHPSRSPISSRTLLVQICHAQEKQQFTKKGIYGQWDPRAESALAAALLKPKRNCKSTSSVPLALETILAAAKMLLLAKPCVSAQAPRLRRSQLQPRRLRRSRLRRGCNFESAPKQVKTTFIHLLPFASSRCTNFHTSAAICLFTLHCSTTQLVALATHSKLLILHFTMHTHTEQTQHTHTQHTLQTSTKSPPHNSPLS